ncbi:threonine aldolase family protein [Hydrotalea flava]|uniref:threonine aldolase family protein n=1 Tax=Hydrotalea flava TaxID=714549 RepID=UPI00082C1771|nr:GntG family PLP-dependent aldolase [Hydrotalea flava]
MPSIIDFRSDTVTRPTPAMLEAMFSAKVGDDVFGEDPSINELEQKAAALFGMEAGLFCPSGTMTNQIAIKVHTQPGDEVICDALSHIYLYEGGGIAFNSGASVRLLQGNRGRITAQQVADAINPNDVHKPVSTLVSLENTSNRGGGACYSVEEIIAIKRICESNHLKLHLDGARLLNALVATNEAPTTYGMLFDSISICLSKGLGTPVGSVLLGTNAFIQKARRVRKAFGGGMRQAGYLAAAGIYALDHHVKRLAQDHEHAQAIATCLQRKDFVGQIMPVETNIIIFEVKGRFTPKAFAEIMEKHHIKVMAISPTQVRMVLHLDIHPSMVQLTMDVINSL